MACQQLSIYGVVHLDETLGLQTPVNTRSCLGQALINQRVLVRALLVS
jgi:hypothetical protein